MTIKEPSRVEHTYTQHLLAPAAEVFPLLCPVREAGWVSGWEPGQVITNSGLAEQDAVFTTMEDGREATWVITRHNPQQRFIEFIKTIPGFTVARIRIQLEDGGNRDCHAYVSYCYTALSPEGKKFVNKFTKKHYSSFMQTWEKELNAFLEKSGS